MKKRLDALLCEQHPELSKTRAQAMIMSGQVYVENQKETKCGAMFPEGTVPVLRGESLKYVSRGGLKLEKAMREFPIDLNGRVCMDIGASTGGFTDCMLQNGAQKVYSVDVGKGQLAWKLRNDERVVVMEKTNIRFVRPEDIADVITFVSIDVSFISLILVLPVALSLLDENKEIVMLIKPQFEAGREKVGKKGVVRDKAVHEEVIEKIITFVLSQKLLVKGLSYSPVKGPEGNIEYLLYVGTDRKEDGKTAGRPVEDAQKDAETSEYAKGDALAAMIHTVVERAHEELDK